MTTERMTAERLKEEFGLTVKAEFVPWSQSRSFDAKIGTDVSKKNLNWRVTLQKHNPEARFEQNRVTDIITTDYSAGIGHCPADKLDLQGKWGVSGRGVHECKTLIAAECETGVRHVWDGHARPAKGENRAILLDPADVVYSLVQDASAIDSPTYEDWAAECGYDADSRTGEAIYRQCLEIGLKLRAALGDVKLAELREAFQDF